MAFDAARYRSGYSIGVGGVVLSGERVLLVRSALGRRAGEWSIPGGFVEPGETIDAAVRREILEEAGVNAGVLGIIAVRSRVTVDENSAYIVFLLQAGGDETRPDGFEVDEARFVALDAVAAQPRLNVLSKLVLAPLLERRAHMLTFEAHPDYSSGEYVLYL